MLIAFLIACAALIVAFCMIFNLFEKLARLRGIEAKCEYLRSNYSTLETENAVLKSNLEQEKKNLAEKIQLLESVEKKLADTFKALSSEALSQNNQSFLDLAQVAFSQLQEKAKADIAMNTKSVEDLVDPIKKALDGVKSSISEMEKTRVGAQGALLQQISDSMAAQEALRKETSRLASALKSSNARGYWGEIQLRRLVEISGMMEHCDFQNQVSIDNESSRVRPDMVIFYPGDNKIVVDAKTPLSAYLKYTETDDENQRQEFLREHAKQLRDHVMQLSKKEYWAQLPQASDFVVMFIPGDALLSEAMTQDPDLMEFALRKNVIIATPATLLGLLRMIAFGWQQMNLNDNAKQIVEQGQELYGRLCDLSKHFASLGKSLASTVDNYNKTTASFQNRILVSAKKFQKISGHEKEISEPILIKSF